MKNIRPILCLKVIFALFFAVSPIFAATIIGIHEDFDSVITTNGIQNTSLGIAVEIPYPAQFSSIREGCRIEYIYERTELTAYYSLSSDASLNELKSRLSLEPDLFVLEERDALRGKQGLCASFRVSCPLYGTDGGCSRENFTSNVTSYRMWSTNFGETQQTTPANQVLNKCGDVESGMCDPANKPKWCVDGSWVDRATTCGCPSGQLAQGDVCEQQQVFCPNDRILNECEKTNVTKYTDVTYIFDRGYNVTVSEPYTFEKEECYKLIQHFGGENCSEIINSTRSVPTTTTGEPVPVGMKVVECSRCPSVCERKPPINLTCGVCVCPGNQGFCDSSGERSVVNDTPVYCADELLLIQKADNRICQNNFECLSNFCSKGECYDVRSNVEKQANIIDRILNWIKRLFGLTV